MIAPVRELVARAVRYARDRKEFAERARQLDFSPVLPPWSRLRRDDTEVGRLRRLAVDSLWMHVSSRVDRLFLLFLAVLWTPRAWLRAARLTRRHGRYVQMETGISPLRQWRDAVLAASRFNYSPTAYHLYRFFDGTRPLGAYLQEMELAVLHMRDTDGVSTRVLPDKVLFFEECVRLQLATPPIVAVFAPGEEERWIGRERGVFPRGDLFLKDAGGQQGEGTERWVYDRDAERWVRRGAYKNDETMLAHLRERGEKRACIVQPVVENHPLIRRYSPDALCTLRIITSWDPGVDARPKLVRACFKIARSGAEVDNLHAGGLACAVDPFTGMLGVARGVGPSDGTHRRHPDTGAEISGVVLPYFHEAVALARRAHTKLDGLPWSVGWDVAISPAGPLLLEGNTLWGADLAQAPRPEPFDPEFVARLAERLGAAGSRAPLLTGPPRQTGRATRADRGSGATSPLPATPVGASPRRSWSTPPDPSGDPFDTEGSHASAGEASDFPTIPR